MDFQTVFPSNYLITVYIYRLIVLLCKYYSHVLILLLKSANHSNLECGGIKGLPPKRFVTLFNRVLKILLKPHNQMLVNRLYIIYQPNMYFYNFMDNH